MSLYSLATEYEVLKEMLTDPECDIELIKDTMEGLQGDIEAKAENYGKIIRMMQYDSAACKAEEKRFHNKAQTIDNRVDYLKKRMMDSMDVAGMKTIKTQLFEFRIKKNGGIAPLVLRDGITPDDVPPEFIKVRVEFDKDAIRKAAEKGECEFAHIGERGKSLTIR